MSGAKRRTKYRKHVETDMLEGLPEPGEGEEIVRVEALCGGNMLEVLSPDGEKALCLLPAKFRKLVWIKRGNFLIASKSDEDYLTATGAKGRVKYTVVHILFKDQIKHLRQADLWPVSFEEGGEGEDEEDEEEGDEEDGEDNHGDNGGEEEDSDIDSMDGMFVNPNHRAAAMMAESDSESETESESEDEGEGEGEGNEDANEVDGNGSCIDGRETGATATKDNATANEARSADARPIKVLSFDLDDTIFECAPVLTRAAQVQHEFLEENFPELAKAVPLEHFKTLFREALDTHAENAHNLTFIRKQALRRAAEMTEHDPEEVVEPAFRAFIDARNDVGKHIFPGVLEALRRLKEKGYQIVSLTNGNCDVTTVQAFMEPEAVFEHSVTAESAGAAKPEAAPFQKIMELTGVSHPSEVLHIGDNLNSDVAGARAFGMRTLWVNRQEVDKEHGADAVLRCVSDLDDAVIDALHAGLEDVLRSTDPRKDAATA
ncbi:S1-like domain-containing protein C146.08c [Hondaea fermentalgiana]|uniref:S1-like domain-containing protein C146.08c n=1 Tax=Hondaea fermentalgiana TaxID=2315210 RepID=A0A2R5GUD2_9STRA|nr:S1-like domain-containing protein C146.08c [Hondaea fermentalgiana]|eukprot:GBG34477.1 S1-like domain-containing protein C146.08c [Hondaea fermentalgiana]